MTISHTFHSSCLLESCCLNTNGGIFHMYSALIYIKCYSYCLSHSISRVSTTLLYTGRSSFLVVINNAQMNSLEHIKGFSCNKSSYDVS